MTATSRRAGEVRQPVGVPAGLSKTFICQSRCAYNLQHHARRRLLLRQRHGHGSSCRFLAWGRCPVLWRWMTNTGLVAFAFLPLLFAMRPSAGPGRRTKGGSRLRGFVSCASVNLAISFFSSALASASPVKRRSPAAVAACSASRRWTPACWGRSPVGIIVTCRSGSAPSKCRTPGVALAVPVRRSSHSGDERHGVVRSWTVHRRLDRRPGSDRPREVLGPFFFGAAGLCTADGLHPSWWRCSASLRPGSADVCGTDVRALSIALPRSSVFRTSHAIAGEPGCGLRACLGRMPGLHLGGLPVPRSTMPPRKGLRTGVRRCCCPGGDTVVGEHHPDRWSSCRLPATACCHAPLPTANLARGSAPFARVLIERRLLALPSLRRCLNPKAAARAASIIRGLRRDAGTPDQKWCFMIVVLATVWFIWLVGDHPGSTATPGRPSGAPEDRRPSRTSATRGPWLPGRA